jgi:hypothetical protein
MLVLNFAADSGNAHWPDRSLIEYPVFRKIAAHNFSIYFALPDFCALYVLHVLRGLSGMGEYFPQNQSSFKCGLKQLHR